MKTSFRLTFLVLLVATVLFSGCGIKDNQPPKIYLVGSSDTTIILREKFIDPGFIAEDNVTHTENIQLSNDLIDVIDVNTDGYATRHQLYEVTYTAVDEEGNESTVTRTVNVQNISTPYAGSFDVYRRTSTFFGDTAYRATISVDTRVAGRLKVSKVYYHYDQATNKPVYYKVNADLWASDLTTTVPHYDNASNNSGIGFMGISNINNSVPWYRGLGYDEAQQLRRFEYINIQTNTYTDSLGVAAVYITGSTEGDGITPKSRIEYIGEDISKIILYYTVTNNTVSPATVDQIKEEYTPVEIY